MNTTDVLWVCTISIAVAVALYSVSGRLRKSYVYYKQKKRNAAIVQKLLQASIPQRSTFRLEVTQGDFKGLCAEGVCGAADKKTFHLQVTNTFGVHQWIAVPISMFFPVTLEGVQTFYHFTSMAHAAHRKENYTELTFVLPPSISPGQNRAFLRFSPPKPLVLALSLWLLQGTRPLPQSRESLAKPFLLSMPQTNNDMELDNISAGGMRILLYENGMKQYSEYFKPDARLLFLLVLVGKNKKEIKKMHAISPKIVDGSTTSAQGSIVLLTDSITQKNPKEILKKNESTNTIENTNDEEAQVHTQSFMLSCRVRALIHAEDDALWQICTRFDAWAAIEEDVDKISWFPTDSDKSVPPLATWIMRAHMEQTKKI